MITKTHLYITAKHGLPYFLSFDELICSLSLLIACVLLTVFARALLSLEVFLAQPSKFHNQTPCNLVTERNKSVLQSYLVQRLSKWFHRLYVFACIDYICIFFCCRINIFLGYFFYQFPHQTPLVLETLHHKGENSKSPAAVSKSHCKCGPLVLFHPNVLTFFFFFEASKAWLLDSWDMC